MVDMIIDQRALRACDRILNCLQLLGDIDAGPLLINHCHDGPQVAGCPVEAFNDRRVAGVDLVSHLATLPRRAPGVYYIPHGG